jgi:hypothetical protein
VFRDFPLFLVLYLAVWVDMRVPRLCLAVQMKTGAMIAAKNITLPCRQDRNDFRGTGMIGGDRPIPTFQAFRKTTSP